MVSELCAPEHRQHVEPLTGPWQDVVVDLMGPLPTGESLLVVVDYYSRFYKVRLLWSTTMDEVIGFLGPVFTRHVQCEIRQKTTVRLPDFPVVHRIVHQTKPPLWPQANGDVEMQKNTLLHEGT